MKNFIGTYKSLSSAQKRNMYARYMEQYHSKLAVSAEHKEVLAKRIKVIDQIEGRE